MSGFRVVNGVQNKMDNGRKNYSKKVVCRAVRRAGRKEIVRLLECGSCGQFHPDGPPQPGGSANFKNDCRYDDNRFSSDEDFTKRTGLPCVEVWLDEQE